MGSDEEKKGNSPLQMIKQAYYDTLYFRDDDRMVVDLWVSAYIAGSHPSTPERFWVYIIGPPSGTKSESAKPFSGLPDGVFISSMTSEGLASGYRDDDGGDPSLLARLDRKTLIVKDLTSWLKDNKNKMAKIYGDLRDAFDGDYCKQSGTTGLVRYKASFGFIGCVTDYIDSISEQMQSLGERFLSFRLSRYEETLKDKADNCNRIDPFIIDKRRRQQSLAQVVGEQMNRLRRHITEHPDIFIPSDSDRRVLGRLATLLSVFRSSPIDSRPAAAEEPYRIYQQLWTVAVCHAISDLRDHLDESDLTLVRRIVIDSLPTHRRRLLLCLYCTNPHTTLTSLVRRIRADHHLTESVLEQYIYVNLVDVKTELDAKGNRIALYNLSDQARELLDETGLFRPGPHAPRLHAPVTTTQTGAPDR